MQCSGALLWSILEEHQSASQEIRLQGKLCHSQCCSELVYPFWAKKKIVELNLQNTEEKIAANVELPSENILQK